DLQAVAVLQRGGFAPGQRRTVELHAVGAAVLDEIDAVEVAHHRVDARHAGRAEHPFAILGTADAAASLRKDFPAAAAELRGLSAEYRQCQRLHRHAQAPLPPAPAASPVPSRFRARATNSARRAAKCSATSAAIRLIAATVAQAVSCSGGGTGVS